MSHLVISADKYGVDFLHVLLFYFCKKFIFKVGRRIHKVDGHADFAAKTPRVIIHERVEVYLWKVVWKGEADIKAQASGDFEFLKHDAKEISFGKHKSSVLCLRAALGWLLICSALQSCLVYNSVHAG